MELDLIEMRPLEFAGSLSIDGYGPDFFRVNGKIYHGPCFLTPSGMIDWTGPEDSAPLYALAERIDVLLLGMGAETCPIWPAFRAASQEISIGLEPMPTPSACRTYNVLLGEGRRIGAALLPCGPSK